MGDDLMNDKGKVTDEIYKELKQHISEKAYLFNLLLYYYISC